MMADHGAEHNTKVGAVKHSSWGRRMAGGRWWLAAMGTVLAAFAAGCFNGPRVATYLTAPPAQRHVVPYRNAADRVRNSVGVKPIRVPVGPPKAELEVLILEPGDYGVSVTTQPSTGREQASMEMQIRYRARSTTRPVASRGTVFLLHGYSATKESMLLWGIVLADHGYRCVLVDLRGHGRSTGDVFSLGKYETADMTQVLDYLSQRGLCDAEVGVMGWSFGADLGLFWGSRDRRVKTVFAIAPYDRPEQALANVAAMVGWRVSPDALKEGMEIAAKRLEVNWEDWSGSAAAGSFAGKSMIVRGSADTVSTAGDVEAIRQAAASRAAVITLDGANHIDIGLGLLPLKQLVFAWFDGGQRERPASSRPVTRSADPG